MKAVYKFHLDCGRMGDLEGVFVEDKDLVGVLINEGLEVYFGEVLGKHSEVCSSLDQENLILVSDNPEVVKIIEEYQLSSGYNPFDYETINFEHESIEEDETRRICEEILKIKKNDSSK